MSNSPILRIPNLPAGSADGQTLRWESGTNTWDANSSLIVADSGNVGIGVTDPSLARLVVASTLTNNNSPSTNGGNILMINPGITDIEGVGGIEFKGSGASNGYGSKIISLDAGGLLFGRRTASAAWTESMRIDSAGNVGIGISSWGTSSPLVVENGGIGLVAQFKGDALGPNMSRALQINAQTTTSEGDTWQIDANSGTGVLTFATNSIERMRLDASGNVLVGTTSPINTSKMSVLNGTANSAFVGQTSGADTAIAAMQLIKASADTSTSNRLITFFSNGGGAGQGSIVASGAGVAAFASFSDVRLKENIAPLQGELANIMALNPVEFDYKDGSGRQIGFVAQEIRNVYPDSVGVPDDPEDMLSVAGWSKTEARLVKAIQELAAEVEALKA